MFQVFRCDLLGGLLLSGVGGADSGSFRRSSAGVLRSMFACGVEIGTYRDGSRPKAGELEAHGLCPMA